jgi:hypothetical protein
VGFPWQPIRDSAALQRYWRDDLAREALFWHVQQSLSKNNVKDVGLGFDCRVLYQRAQCAINIESPGEAERKPERGLPRAGESA